ncbi:MAG: hypothetical protein WCG99_03160 [Candidatus Berkelbacteria bacterium]
MEIFSIDNQVFEIHHQSYIGCNPGYIVVDTYNKINHLDCRMYYLVVKWWSLDGSKYAILTFDEGEIIHGKMGLCDEQDAVARHDRVVEDITNGKIVPTVNRVEYVR